jgi:diguanylate cyclase (GGDEF)-like protein/PAS domain S-box-containing protein
MEDVCRSSRASDRAKSFNLLAGWIESRSHAEPEVPAPGESGKNPSKSSRCTSSDPASSHFAWGAAFVLAASSLGITYSFAIEYDRAIRGFAEESAMQSLLADVLQLMVDEETSARGYAITGDFQFLEPYRESGTQLPATLGELQAWLGKRGEHEDARYLAAAIRERHEFTRETVELVRAGQIEQARARIATGEGRRRMDRVRDLARSLEQRRRDALRDLSNRIAQSRIRTTAALTVGALLTLLIAASAFATVRRDLRRMDNAARALEDGERRFRTIAESASDLVQVHEINGASVYASPSSLRLLGYTPEELMQKKPASLLPDEERDRVIGIVQDMLTREDLPPPIVHRLQHKDGSFRWFETRFEPIRDEDGVPRRLHSSSRDVEARVATDRAIREQQAELAREAEQLREISHRDELTGLLNRRGLLELGASVLAAARDAGKPAVAYFIDLDGLKEINDRLGHEEGDRAICDAAMLLREVARASDLVARLGGDELVVLGLLREMSCADAFRERLKERIEHRNENTMRRYRLSMSIGLSTWSPEGESRTLEQLIADADAAMYEHKQSRRKTTARGESIVRDESSPLNPNGS